MTPDAIIEALRLPPEAFVNQRIAKVLLAENGAVTTADKRAIDEGIEELLWKAELKSSTSGIPAYKDEEREYLEIAVLSLSLREGFTLGEAKAARIVELVHRAIPYPVLLISCRGGSLEISVATKRWAQNEAGRTVLDDVPVRSIIVDAPWAGQFLTSLALARQVRRNFRTVYESWTSELVSNEVAKISGFYRASGDPDHTAKRSADLEEYRRLQGTISQLRESARAEAQINRRVELNLDIQRAEIELCLIKDHFNAEI